MISLNNKRIGYWLTDKKIKILDIKSLEAICIDNGIDLIKLDLEKDFESQGPFDLIFHKMTDLLFKFSQHKHIFWEFQSYVSRHPEMLVIDPPENVLKLLNRQRLQKLLEQSVLFTQHSGFFLPASVELLQESDALYHLNSHSIPFPIVCKPCVPGNKTSNTLECSGRQMTIVLNESGLESVEFPCFAQAFVNHNAVLWKVYVVGDEHRVLRRSSIRNLHTQPDAASIHFSSAEVSKASSSSPLSQVGAGELLETREVGEERTGVLARALRKLLQLDLFGFDVILEKDSERCAVIDVNPFPSYNGYDAFSNSLIRLFEKKVVSCVAGLPA